MKNGDEDIVDLLKRFEVVNKEVIQFSRRLSEMKSECAMLRRKVKSVKVAE